MDWIACYCKQPTESAIYKVRTVGAYGHVKKAYYDKFTESWVYDDGVWLPVDISPYVLYWKENKR